MKRTPLEKSRKFGTLDDFDKAYFPHFYKQNSEGQKIKNPGDFGRTLADEFLAKVKLTLKK